jgi:hypothetical protein
MQQIVTCEPWTTTSSHEDKNWRRTQHTPVHFKPYYVWITSLHCGAVGRYKRRVNDERDQWHGTCFESVV